MKIAIIGAGNMGGAIAVGIAKSHKNARSGHAVEIALSDPTPTTLDAAKHKCPEIETTTSNCSAVKDADIVILAVKPWVLPSVISEISAALKMPKQTIVSVAGGVSIDDLDSMLLDSVKSNPDEEAETLSPVFHIIPTTALLVGKSMTFISSRRADDDLIATVMGLFTPLGETAYIQERLMGAGTALSSCGIAYAYKYAQACVQAGVQLGFYPKDALRYTIATIEGAMAMLRDSGALPQQEIDRVTTPGGMTIKGINQLDHDGFTSAVVNAILKPLQK